MLIEMSDVDLKKRVLFVCTQNKVRSLTAEHLYRARPDLEVKSCGTATFAKNRLTKELTKWADVIFTFDETQMEAISAGFRKETASKPVVCLGLADIFTYKSDALVVKLITRLDPYLGRPNARKCPRNSIFSQDQVARQPKVVKSGTSSRTLVSNLLAAVGVRRQKEEPAN